MRAMAILQALITARLGGVRNYMGLLYRRIVLILIELSWKRYYSRKMIGKKGP